jgi:hypothetical protein
MQKSLATHRDCIPGRCSDGRSKAFWEIEVKGTTTSVNTHQTLNMYIILVEKPEGERLI